MSPPMKLSAFATLGPVLDLKQSWEYGKFHLVSSIVSLAQLVSPSLALLAKLVMVFLFAEKEARNKEKDEEKLSRVEKRQEDMQQIKIMIQSCVKE